MYCYVARISLLYIKHQKCIRERQYTVYEQRNEEDCRISPAQTSRQLASF